MAKAKKRQGSHSGENGSSENGEKKTKQDKMEAPKTGWKDDVPSKEGGSEHGYLTKPPYAWHSKEFKATYHAKCWCGKVEVEYHGDPVDAKHCHCTQCQFLHGAPFQWAALYHKTSVRLKAECDPMYLKFYSTQAKHSDHDVPCKMSCRNCGSHLFDEGRNMVMAYPPSFGFKDQKVPDAFAPSCHIFYNDRVMNLYDGVPKWSGHKNDSELLPHDANDDGDRIGLGKEHKSKGRH